MEEEIKILKKERLKILKSLNIEENYNEIKYTCEKCKDTGFIENEKCSCLKEKLKVDGYERSNLGNLIKTQNFESFDFSSVAFSADFQKSYILRCFERDFSTVILKISSKNDKPFGISGFSYIYALNGYLKGDR
jgi:hypothetical protein